MKKRGREGVEMRCLVLLWGDLWKTYRWVVAQDAHLFRTRCGAFSNSERILLKNQGSKFLQDAHLDRNRCAAFLPLWRDKIKTLLAKGMLLQGGLRLGAAGVCFRCDGSEWELWEHREFYNLLLRTLRRVFGYHASETILSSHPLGCGYTAFSKT